MKTTWKKKRKKKTTWPLVPSGQNLELLANMP